MKIIKKKVVKPTTDECPEKNDSWGHGGETNWHYNTWDGGQWNSSWWNRGGDYWNGDWNNWGWNWSDNNNFETPVHRLRSQWARSPSCLSLSSAAPLDPQDLEDQLRRCSTGEQVAYQYRVGSMEDTQETQDRGLCEIVDFHQAMIW